MSDNLALWRLVEKTPLDQTKPITGKSYQGTSPKPHYLVRKATETFGPVGIGWGFTIENERIEEGAGGERMHIARVKVWYEWNGKRGEVEHIGGTQFSGIRSSGKPFTDEDAPKKSVTDALIKALSMIGFAGDIFIGLYDDSKYVAELREDQRAEKSSNSAPPARNAGARDALPPVDRAPANNEPPSDALQTALTAIAMALDSPSLSDWWKAHKNGLKSVLSDAEYLKAFDAAKQKAGDLKVMEDNPQADERNAA
jgi:hypothetical protein